ncbi:unnamed protein product [Paramecium sonneborni]|uniref:Uncharacterized protein n=1 Tax=Paramecium sonneborni TaxID=65129 RepID=A0A8S1R5I5_9CILI|nr:unnamed protein product [Paramecium sonneborni]
MKNISFSQDFQALALIDTYNVVLNERKRNRQCTNFQIAQKKLVEQSVKIRRKSCHCQLCGNMSVFQFDMMNVPFQKKEKQVEKEEPQIQEFPGQPIQRRSIFYRLQSLKTQEMDKVRLSLQIHGCDQKYLRQNTLQQLIAESNERPRKGSINSSGIVNTSTSDNHSVKSLNINTCSEYSSTLIQSPLNAVTTSRHKIIDSKKLKMMSSYFSQSARSLKTTQYQQISKSKVLILPKITQKKKKFDFLS